MFFLFQRKHRPPPTVERNNERYALDSGERQTGITLSAIRCDHVARYQLATQLIAEHLKPQVRLFGLDAFCGTGYGTQLLSEQVACTMLGIDASSAAIEFANRHFSNRQTLYAVKEFPFGLPAESFDFIISLESIEHVEADGDFLDTLSSSLKPGGLLIVSTPNAGRWSLTLNPNPFHIRHYTRAELVRLINQRCGLHPLSWFSQDLYQFEENRIVAPLSDDEMCIRPGDDGQILIVAITKEQ